MRKRRFSLDWALSPAVSCCLMLVVLSVILILAQSSIRISCLARADPHRLPYRSQQKSLRNGSEGGRDQVVKDLIRELERWRDGNVVASKVRIYVYDLDEQFNAELVRISHRTPPKIRDPYCDTSFYSAEVAFHKFLLQSPVRTTDPDQADFFYVPIYATCHLVIHHPNNLTRTGLFFKQAMDHVMTSYPFWHRSQGRDHVFMFTQGFSARLSGDFSLYSNAIFLVHNGEMTAPEYTPHKDITVPPNLSNYLTPIYVRSPPLDSHSSHRPPAKRYLAHFGGQVVPLTVADHRGRNYSGGVRQYIQYSLLGHPGYRITGVRTDTYVSDIERSVFCLAPEGWHPWSPRPYYAVLLGCIPVVISDKQELAFEDLVNWDDFAVWVHPRDVGRMDSALRRFTPQDINARMHEMSAAWKLFWYGDQGLANEAILYQLYRRKYLSKLRRKFIS